MRPGYFCFGELWVMICGAIFFFFYGGSHSGLGLALDPRLVS